MDEYTFNIKPIGYIRCVRKKYQSYYKSANTCNIKNLNEYIQIDYKVKERYFLKNGEIQYCLDVRQNLLIDSGCLKKKALKKYSADSILEIAEKTLKDKNTGEVVIIPYIKTLKLE